MFRMLAAALMVLASTPTFAATDAEIIEKQYEAAHWCRIPEDAPSKDASEKACADKVALASQLQKLGYCFNDAERDWRKCQ